jgi:hypothetical protein
MALWVYYMFVGKLQQHMPASQLYLFPDLFRSDSLVIISS